VSSIAAVLEGEAMRRKVLSIVSALALLILLGAAIPPVGRAAVTIVVGQNSVLCPGAQFAKIQDAVNAASAGDSIQICPGTYIEQVSITKPLQLNGNNGAIIRPNNIVANSTGLASGQPIAAIILVQDTTGVTIRNVIVDGVDNGISECAPDLIGVFYRNASGELSHVAVRDVKLNSTLNGCQSGSAVLVQSSNGVTSVVAIEESSIHDYQKNGITANEVGTQVTIEGNVVTGLGPTTGAAQNGIQVGFGAAGSIRHNTVANHIWLPCVSLESCDFKSDDILVFQSNGVSVHHNAIGVSQTGIAIVGDQGQIFDNDVFDSQIFDGVELIGNENTAERNHITHSDQAGVLIAGNENIVRQNTINESALGVLKVAGSVGNVIANNSYFNSPIKLKDPPETPGKASPYR
jgi:nitrous oxidase accessory protein NosD